MMRKMSRMNQRHKTPKNRQKLIASMKKAKRKLRKSTRAANTSKTSMKKSLREMKTFSTS